MINGEEKTEKIEKFLMNSKIFNELKVSVRLITHSSNQNGTENMKKNKK
jgi:hypothetical protein